MNRLKRIITFLTTGILETRLRDLPRFRALVLRSLRVARLALYGFEKDDCSTRASALTYYSLLSIVPVFAMAFGIAKGFGFDKVAQKHIIELAQSANWPDEVIEQILSFANSMLKQAKGGVIAGVGFLMLFYAVLSILQRVEDSFNRIWQVAKARTLFRKVTDYGAIMILTPVFIIIAGSASVVITSEVGIVVRKITLLGPVSHVILMALKFLPYIAVWTMLTMVYMVIPNTKVKPGAAMVAGIVTGTIYQFVQFLYIKFQIGVASYGAIYGGFAAIPLFVAWLNISWTIVLLGAEIAVAVENQETYGFHPDHSRLSIFTTKLLAVRVLHMLVKGFVDNKRPASPTEIAETIEVPLRLVRRILDQLLSLGFVVETTIRVKGESTYQPGRPPEALSLKAVLDAYEGLGEAGGLRDEEGGGEKILAHLKRLSEAQVKAPENVLIRDL